MLLWVYSLRHEWGTFTFLLQPNDSASAWQVLASLLDMGAPILLGAYRDGTHDPVVTLLSYGAYALLGLAALGHLLWRTARA